MDPNFVSQTRDFCIVHSSRLGHNPNREGIEDRFENISKSETAAVKTAALDSSLNLEATSAIAAA
jgi:hypothetical protein